MMDVRREELPDELAVEFERAKRLEWLTLAFLVLDIVLVYLVLGGSEAVRTAWIESFLELIPPIVFLVSIRYMNAPPTRRFPYGLHGVTSVAHLCAGLAILFVGAFLIFNSVTTFLDDQPSEIGTVNLFGMEIWRGWLMIAVMFDSLWAVFLGRAKRLPAKRLHDKVLNADADMNKADWLTAAAAVVGVLGIRFGAPWLDPVAAAFIAINVLKDGYSNARIAMFDLMDMEPTLVDRIEEDPLVERVTRILHELPWVAAVDLRAREEGRVYFFEAQVVPNDERNLVKRLEEARRKITELDWRVYSIAIMPVSTLPKGLEPVPDK